MPILWPWIRPNDADPCGSGTLGKRSLTVQHFSNPAYTIPVLKIFSPRPTTRVVDPDPDWIRIQWGVWIRIRNPDPDPGARKRRK
jgi:hypothetical protein